MVELTSAKCHSKTEGIEAHEIGSNPRRCDECLQYMNKMLVLVRPYTGKDVEFNQIVTAQNMPFLVKDLNLEEFYLYTKKLEMLAACAGLMYQDTLRKTKVNPDTVKKNAGKQSFAEEMKRERDLQRPKKEKKLLDARDKAIAVYTSLGMPLDQAAKMVDEQMAKQGRAVKPN